MSSQAAGGVRGAQPGEASLSLFGLAAQGELAVDDGASQAALCVVVGFMPMSQLCRCWWRGRPPGRRSLREVRHNLAAGSHAPSILEPRGAASWQIQLVHWCRAR